MPLRYGLQMPFPLNFHSLIFFFSLGYSHSESQQKQQSGLGMCLCHLDANDGPSTPTKSISKDKNSTSSSGSNPTGKLSASGFLCPQCQAKYCELPVECRACGLTLVSAPHLARSYHHLFPLPPFEEVFVHINTVLEKEN